MISGARSKPPDLPNFRYRSWLGGGGFADVFLYDQVRPKRQVAVKVLRAGPDAIDQRVFDDEADLMARVSAHPYIVTIHGADIAPDGRPFLVMEYYPKPHYGQRSRGAGLPVQEVLRVGVRLAGAVETAHRAGILHRDIKPANILVSEYDRPGLTDFGIAGVRDGSELAGAEGVTVAYAPPEVLVDSNPGDESADVYSLGATLYSLVAGRAPFELVGGDNSAQAVLQRTLSAPLPTIGRSDVPRPLERLLAQAMDRDPRVRPPSAALLARSLQVIERELRLSPTELELPGLEDDSGIVVLGDDAEATRAGRVQVVRPGGSVRPAQRAQISDVPIGLTRARGEIEPPVRPARFAPAAPPPTETVSRPRRDAPLQPARRPSGPPRWMIVGGAALLLVIVGAVILAAGGGLGGEASPTTSTLGGSALTVPDLPPRPSDVTVTADERGLIVAWDPGQAEEGDTYQVFRTDGEHRGGVPVAAGSSPLVMPAVAEGERPCFEVTALRGARPSSPSDEECLT